MIKATLRELRNNFSRLEILLNEGHQIQIEKKGKPIGLLSAPTAKKPIVMPDFKARAKKIWGDRFFLQEEVEAMREAELESEEG